MDVDSILRDLFTQEGRENPWPLYAALHALGPVVATTPSPGGTVRAVAIGYEAVNDLLRDTRWLNLDDKLVEAGRPDWREHAFYTTLMGTIFFSNGPEHANFRKLFSKVFTPRRVAALEPSIIRLTDTMLDRMAARAAAGEEVDFMAEFAYPVPSGVVGELFGIPESDWAWVPPRTDRINDALNMRNGDPEVLRAADAAAEELLDYYLELIARLRAEPGDDIVSSLIREMDAGEREHRLSDADIARNLVVTYNAAFATTTPMLANGLVELLARPEHAARLRADPELAPAYVDEILRYVTSVHFVMRTASEDLELHGVPVPAGMSVLVMLGGANRDPNRFADPDTFDPDRPDNSPLSFGAGPHYCLGAALSRREAQLALPRILRRFPELRIGDGKVNDSLLLPSYLTLPVTIRG